MHGSSMSPAQHHDPGLFTSPTSSYMPAQLIKLGQNARPYESARTKHWGAPWATLQPVQRPELPSSTSSALLHSSASAYRDPRPTGWQNGGPGYAEGSGSSPSSSESNGTVSDVGSNEWTGPVATDTWSPSNSSSHYPPNPSNPLQYLSLTSPHQDTRRVPSTFPDASRHRNLPATEVRPFDLPCGQQTLPPTTRDHERFRINKPGPTGLQNNQMSHEMSQKMQSHGTFQDSHSAHLNHVRRQCAETMTSEHQENSRISMCERTYGGVGPPNTVAPSPDYYPHSGSMMGPYDGSPASFRNKREDPNFGYPVSLPTLGINEEDLILMATRDLNKFLKSKGISREDIKKIKQQRRTMKNRGYAASCRVKREMTVNDFKSQLEDEQDNIQESKDVNSALEKDIEKIKLHYDIIVNCDLAKGLKIPPY